MSQHGALDSVTSTQIMELLKDVAKDRLVVMVTHNSELANEYSTRIVEIKDGKIQDDSNPFNEKDEELAKPKKIKKPSMSFFTALSLSLNNLMTKKGRTILTAFAGSIGIIGIALILSLSNGVQNYIDKVQEETLTSYPITIQAESLDLSALLMSDNSELAEKANKKEEGKIYSNDTITDTLSIMSSKVKSNNLKEFKKYIEKNSDKLKDYTTAIGYEYNLDLQIYDPDTKNGVVQINPDTVMDSLGMTTASNSYSTIDYTSAKVWTELFENEEVNKQMYNVVTGRMPEKYNEVVLLVDKNNQLTDYVLYALGLKDQKELSKMMEKLTKGKEVKSKQVSYTYEELLNLRFKLVLNTDYYKKENGIWVDKRNDEKYMKSLLKKADEIKVVGIIKPSDESVVSGQVVGGVLYRDSLEKHVIKKINESKIVKEQKKDKKTNVLTGMKFSKDSKFDMNNLTQKQKMYLASLSAEELADLINQYQEQADATYESTLKKLGSVDVEDPTTIYIYAKDFESKENIKDFITEYNNKQKDAGKDENVIEYNDLVGMLMSSVTVIVDMISYVLIAFVSISLVVSSIMIGIITYISVLERTKEIGILRAIGASKKDISRVFNAETLIIGLVAGLFGIGITILLNIPINIIIKNLANVSNISMLPPVGGVVLVIISVVITIIAGLIPARIASKKDPVESLRSE